MFLISPYLSRRQNPTSGKQGCEHGRNGEARDEGSEVESVVEPVLDLGPYFRNARA